MQQVIPQSTVSNVGINLPLYASKGLVGRCGQDLKYQLLPDRKVMRYAERGDVATR